MRLLATLVSVVLVGAVSAQTPAPPPTRALDGPGAPQFTSIPSGNPPATAEGDFVIGPEYAAPPELTVRDGVPAGTVTQFTMDSKQSKFYPGIERDGFGKPDPNNAKTLIVETHPKGYQRTITVYVPAQYKKGTTAPLIVTHDGPRLGQPDTVLPRILDNLIAQKRVPAMVAVMIRTAAATRRARSVVWNTTRCPASSPNSSRRKCCRRWKNTPA